MVGIGEEKKTSKEEKGGRRMKEKKEVGIRDRHSFQRESKERKAERREE